jgi:hypothetical protein
MLLFRMLRQIQQTSRYIRYIMIICHADVVKALPIAATPTKRVLKERIFLTPHLSINFLIRGCEHPYMIKLMEPIREIVPCVDENSSSHGCTKAPKEDLIP